MKPIRLKITVSGSNLFFFTTFIAVKIETMTIRKIFTLLVIVTIMALTIVACSGTKNICPAYSTVDTEMSADHNG
jgi:hypothetical protein